MDEKNIGTLARFMGVSPHTIKYYEKIGILTPERDEKSNYRRYQLSICTDLSECIRYRSMGFSLKELDVLRKTADSRLLDEMLMERLRAVEEELLKLTGIRSFLKEYMEECRRAEEELGEWYIEPFSQIIYCRMQTENLLFTGENLAMDALNIMDYAPETTAVVTLDREYMEGGEKKYSWGQSLSFMEEQPVFEEHPEFISLSPKKVFIAYRRYTGHFVSNGAMAEDIRMAFHEYAPNFPDSVYAFRIKITRGGDGTDWHYFKIVVPLK
ncbi:MerR family transcriptional regulator [Clostridium transplantifaecale]|uniref:MerR family transcriptional regulator n=1 Tax=Clostridium transplantifaecale TaxID=2479838 RepID=UPI000F6404C7|nr:MerR family transcriptional regulator [Clostridium transplantifaecale]